METLKAIYEKGTLRLINPVNLSSSVVRVEIVNKDEILTEEDLRDIAEALREHAEGRTSRFEEVFD